MHCFSSKLRVTKQKWADDQLEETKVNEFIRYLVLQCKQERRRHKYALSKEHDNDHQFAHQMSHDMLNCLQWAHEKLKLWLSRNTFFDSLTQCKKMALEEESKRKKKRKKNTSKKRTQFESRLPSRSAKLHPALRIGGHCGYTALPPHVDCRSQAPDQVKKKKKDRGTGPDEQCFLESLFTRAAYC
jgi:hypothetical protein